MSQYRRSEVVSGLFVAAAAIVFALFAFKVGRFDLMGLLKADAIVCRTYFANVKTLQEGSKVRVGGREVGEVTGLLLVAGAAPGSGENPGGLERLVNEVTFELTYPDLRLDSSSARVLIAQDSLLAPHFLELDPGHWPADSPPPTIFVDGQPKELLIASEMGVGIEELMALAQPAIDDLGAILNTLKQDVLNEQNVDTIGRALGELDGALVEGRQVAATLNRGLLAPANVEALEQTIHNLDSAVADGRKVAARLDSLLDPEQDPRIDRLITDVGAATNELRTNLDAISADLQHLLQHADRTLSETETEIAEATRRLHRTLWQGEQALRKIRANPSVVFFGDDETDLVARDVALTEIRLRGRARPYEQRDERDEDN